MKTVDFDGSELKRKLTRECADAKTHDALYALAAAVAAQAFSIGLPDTDDVVVWHSRYCHERRVEITWVKNLISVEVSINDTDVTWEWGDEERRVEETLQVENTNDLTNYVTPPPYAVSALVAKFF